jgi:positive regulator of sigma E activity
MTDLKSPTLIYLKGLLFLLAGCVAAGLVVAEQPTLKVFFLLAIAIWSFCRFYYFAFYVIERYIDPSFRFAGLGSFAVYLVRSRRPRTDGER